MDNRPLKFDEFETRINQAVFVSATPAEQELTKSMGVVVEQLIRPTGLVDPPIILKPAKGQVEDVVGEIRLRAERGERVLVTTLTKRMAEDLSEYMMDLGMKSKYLHSDIDAIERTEIIRDLRLGRFDVLVGINLLREGLDLPEVSLVAILDADKEGFLRGHTALIQTCGRAARNVNGVVIMYADVITEAIRRTLEETDRRRARQTEFNRQNDITPRSVQKGIKDILDTVYEADYPDIPMVAEDGVEYVDAASLPRRIDALRKEMREAAKALEFERAAALRDQVLALEQQFLSAGDTVALKSAGPVIQPVKPQSPGKPRPRRGSSSGLAYRDGPFRRRPK
jgi:excinuclease ABC subunit B